MKENWIVLRVKSNREYAVASFLEGKGIPCFLPTKVMARRKAKALAPPRRPLFPGYLFAQALADAPSCFQYVPGTCGVVAYNGKAASVSPEEIESIRTMTSSGLAIDSYEGLQPGIKIRVAMGPLAGIEGEIVRLRNSNRFVVNVGLLNKAISVEIDAHWLQQA